MSLNKVSCLNNGLYVVYLVKYMEQEFNIQIVIICNYDDIYTRETT